jgi:hypothetical protein
LKGESVTSEVTLNREFSKIKRRVNYQVQDLNQNLKQKLSNLKLNNTFGPDNFEVSHGSRKIRASTFSKTLIPRVPGLRPHRQNRNANAIRQRRRRVRQKELRRDRDREAMEQIELELQKRDPINESGLVITDAMKEITRLSAKFCPMPKGPVDTYDLFLAFENFSSNCRWGWFHHQKNKRRIGDDDDQNDTLANDDTEDDFVMVPWYKRTDRIAPKGNVQLEAGLERLREHLFNPNNRRRVKDNLSDEQRKSIKMLRNLPNTENVQLTFEDKGSRFVFRNLNYQDNAILEQLADDNHFDELQVDPTDRVKQRLSDICAKWQADLNNFHPNIIHFLTDLSDSKCSKVKGLVKCHKPANADGLHDIRLLLASGGTPTNPASKLFQFAIAHIFPHLTSKMKDTKAILTKLLEIKDKFPNGLPEGAVNVGCDVKKLYPSIDSVLALIAVDAWLQLYPNPDGLSRELLMDLGKICVEENSCEFLGRFFCPNTGTATGPPHA